MEDWMELLIVLGIATLPDPDRCVSVGVVQLAKGSRRPA